MVKENPCKYEKGREVGRGVSDNKEEWRTG
jgi:hypothetical protein